MMKLKDILNEGFKSEYKGNDSIIWKKGKTQGDVTNFTPYYKGHDIDTGGHNFKTEKELKDFIKDYILSNQLYNKYRFESVIEENVDCNDCKDRLVKVSESLGIEIWEHAQPVLWQEAEYQGKKVQLGKVTRGGTKKFQVYVKDGDNVKKVSFGDTSGLSIKTKDPERRKSFKARHKCDQKKDKTSAGYWSCRMWSGPDSVKNMLSK